LESAGLKEKVPALIVEGGHFLEQTGRQREERLHFDGRGLGFGLLADLDEDSLVEAPSAILPSRGRARRKTPDRSHYFETP